MYSIQQRLIRYSTSDLCICRLYFPAPHDSLHALFCAILFSKLFLGIADVHGHLNLAIKTCHVHGKGRVAALKWSCGRFLSPSLVTPKLSGGHKTNDLASVFLEPWTCILAEQDNDHQGLIILYVLAHRGQEVDVHGPNCDHILTFYRETW